MGALSETQRSVLTDLIRRCGDAVLDGLRDGFPVEGSADDRTAELARMIQDEWRDRRRRDTALAPLAPMFAARQDGVAGLTFPPSARDRAWRVAAEREADLLPLLDGAGPTEGDWTTVADRLCAACAAAVRDRHGQVWPDAPREAREELAGCFDLGPLARRALPRLPAWLERPDDEQAAGLRLLIQDANAVGEHGGRRMVDILFAHVADAERMLRVVTRTSRSAGNELVLGHSEMAVFIDRLLTSVTERVARLGVLGSSPGEAQAQAAVADAEWCAAVLSELDLTLQLRPDSPWGKTTRMARVKLSGQLSGLMRSAGAAAHAALPMKRQTIAGRMTRMAPWLEAPTEGEPIEAAAALLGLVTALRGPAVVFGSESDRQRLNAELTDYLTIWANEALDCIADGEAPDVDRALRLVGIAARYLTSIEALEAARTVRRRAATAETARATAGAASRAL
ncbi:hypothetical protein [Brevundimonas sp.]|uniref:hypothetical protein n=1 Tax=Brevundimonas sp. TaxID=1871086 RepID=UPI0019A0A06E|nr:hypothetical protein [Brevundimonas sp.]MBD3835795.1 hypothetical protein [Brevundimonas sp.]